MARNAATTPTAISTAGNSADGHGSATEAAFLTGSHVGATNGAAGVVGVEDPRMRNATTVHRTNGTGLMEIIGAKLTLITLIGTMEETAKNVLITPTATTTATKEADGCGSAMEVVVRAAVAGPHVGTTNGAAGIVGVEETNTRNATTGIRTNGTGLTEATGTKRSSITLTGTMEKTTKSVKTARTATTIVGKTVDGSTREVAATAPLTETNGEEKHRGRTERGTRNVSTLIRTVGTLLMAELGASRVVNTWVGETAKRRNRAVTMVTEIIGTSSKTADGRSIATIRNQFCLPRAFRALNRKTRFM